MAQIRANVEKFIDYTIPECLIPELGEPKKGKVRDIYMKDKNVIMVTNDRVSAFDYILPSLIPFKGQVLNKFSAWAMRNTKDICPNALIENVDESVVVQKKMKNLNVECIVRSYLWGSMAGSYEKGEREFCGIKVPDGLHRYQKLDGLWFTPTTKAEVGHDENMTMEEVSQLLGKVTAEKVKKIALELFKRGSELMKKRGLILLDTKYEFGFDEKGDIYVIDEINTPDSSRMIEVKEYESKYPQIAKGIKEKNCSVNDLLKARPDLKLKEFSKQYVRDTLLEMGFNPASGQGNLKLSKQQIVECSARYIEVYERVTGEKFEFPQKVNSTPQERILSNLKAANMIKGCCCVVAAGSDSDLKHMETIKAELAKYGVPCQLRICSAHKQPARLQKILERYNDSIEPIVFVGCAGGTDALSGTASYHSVWPVVSCPPDGMNQTCLTNPPMSSNAFCCKPSNVGRFVAQVFSINSKFIRESLEKNIAEKINKLEAADAKLNA